MKEEKLELLADFYEFTMSNGYFEKNKNDIAYFDIFFRNIPDKGGYAIVARTSANYRICASFKLR